MAQQAGATMSETAVRRGQTVDDVIERLRDAIFSGRIVAGQRLIANDLTLHLGVSRGSVREAMQRLAAEGLIDIVPNRGAMVRRLSRDHARELFEIRINLEGLAAKLAAEHITQSDHRERFIKVWQQVRPTEIEQPWPTFMQHNRLFHRTIVGISANKQLAQLIDNLHLPIIMFQVGQSMRPETLAHSHRDHHDIAEAILAADSLAAKAAMETHLQRSARWILELPNSAFEL